MKRLLILAVALICFASAQNVKAPGFVINGHIKGLAEKSAVFITDANKPTDTLARSVVKNGAFVLKGHVVEANLYELSFGGDEKNTGLVIRNENVQLAGSAAHL